MRRTDPSLVPGALVGSRYRLRALLGQGGTGAVYEAHDEHEDRTVAIKLLPLERDSDRDARVRFEREAQSAQLIGHPSIVRVLASGYEGDTPYLVLERLYGEDLHARITTLGALPVHHGVALACEIGGAVAAAHAAGIVHRDLKPKNVFLTDHGSTRVKLLDFGVAKWLGARLRLTGPSQMIGTPAFMAPEQLMRGDAADPRCDVYALGVTLFAMLTARVPFEASSEVELFMMIANDPPPDLRTLCSTAPEGLAEVIARALAKKPNERFATADQLVAALKPYGR
jgi:eukaryotic-like serine/threonine-protein kinase